MAASFSPLLIVAFGYPLPARIQVVLGILSAALIVALPLSSPRAGGRYRDLLTGDGPVILVVTGVVPSLCLCRAGLG
jgi:hypothetical protein